MKKGQLPAPFSFVGCPMALRLLLLWRFPRHEDDAVPDGERLEVENERAILAFKRGSDTSPPVILPLPLFHGKGVVLRSAVRHPNNHGITRGSLLEKRKCVSGLPL